MVRIAVFLSLAFEVAPVEVDQDADENDSKGNAVPVLDPGILAAPSRRPTYTMQMVMVLAMLVPIGFSQVLLPLLLLHVAVDADESEVLDEERPTTRLGVMSQALFTPCSSDATRTLLPILGSRRAVISSMLLGRY